MRFALSKLLAAIYTCSLYLALPILPLLAAAVFMRPKYVRHYPETIRKLLVHIAALREGPAVHYFNDVFGKKSEVPEEMLGSCIQCGNCCMNHRCVFLEPLGVDKFQCGIYASPFRRWSNCGSFPLNKTDIDRYQCPSYFVKDWAPVQFVEKTPPV